MTTTRPPDCRCGHSYERHLGHVGVVSDPCAGETPGFCGCSGYGVVVDGPDNGQDEGREPTDLPSYWRRLADASLIVAKVAQRPHGRGYSRGVATGLLRAADDLDTARIPAVADEQRREVVADLICVEMESLGISGHIAARSAERLADALLSLLGQDGSETQGGER